MKITIISLAIFILLLATISEATVNNLVMKVGADKTTSLMTGVPEYQQMAEMYNLIQNPKGAVTDLAMQQISKNSPEFYKAYSIITNPKSFAQGKITEQICGDNKELCDAYNKGMQLYSAAGNPQAAATQYALQEIAKQDPKTGQTLQQAYMIKGYVDILKAGPAGKNEASVASQKPAPTQAMPTTNAVADAFEGKFAQESIENCLLGFSLGKTNPQVGDIKNCQINNEEQTDISFAFNQDKITAKVSGKGCTLSKTGTRVYIYNSDSCAMMVEKTIIPKSAKGTYAAFDKPKDKVELAEGRFISAEDIQEFKFEDRGYVVPKGAILYYKNKEFDMDFGELETDKFSMYTYEKGAKVGALTVQKLGNLKVRQTPYGVEFVGAAKITSAGNTVISNGKIVLSSSGEPVRIGERTDALIFSDKIKTQERASLRTVESPKDAIRLKTKDDPVEFSLCGETDEKLPSVDVCSKQGELTFKSTNPKSFKVSHVKTYAAKKDEALKDILKEIKPDADKNRLNRYQRVVCDYNKALKSRSKSCADINKGDELLVESVLLEPKGDIIANVRSQKGKNVLKIEGSADITSLGTVWSITENEGTSSISIKPGVVTLKEIGEPIISKKPTVEVTVGEAKIVESEEPKVTVTVGPVRVADEIIGPVRIMEGKRAAEEVAPEDLIKELQGPLDISIDVQGHMINSNKGQTEICSCSIEKPKGITGMAGADCSANACSVNIETPEIPKPIITTQGTLNLPETKPHLKFNGKALTFKGGVFQVDIVDDNFGELGYQLDKQGTVALRGEFNPLDFGQPILLDRINKQQRDYLNAMCEADSSCKAAWLKS